MRLLLVEDDACHSLCPQLRERYTVDTTTFAEFPPICRLVTYDLCIFDLTHLGKTCLEVCRRVRLQRCALPILVLVENAEIADRVAALDLGVDDYLIKPCVMEELWAVVRALLRWRTVIQYTPQKVLAAGDLLLNVCEHVAYHAGKALNLRRKELLLLEYFLRHINQVVTRDELLDYVWEEREDPMTNTVDVHIKVLRDKIDKPHGSHHLLTAHGLGYKLVAVHG